MDPSKTRYFAAIAAYGVIAVLAALTLDGKLQYAVWIFLAGLALRTTIAYKARW